MNALNILKKEKKAYFEKRKEFLDKYKGKWVAIYEGKVVGIGEKWYDAVKSAYDKLGYIPLYINKVGEEEKVSVCVYRKRLVRKKIFPISAFH